LETENSKLKLFFDQAESLMVVIGCDETVHEINQKACEFLGYACNELRGENWFDLLLPKDQRENAKTFFHDMLAGELCHVHSEYPILTKQGQKRVFNFHNILVSDENGKTIGVISSGEDVTERKRHEVTLKEVENRLQVSLDSMIEGCQIIDFDWRYAYVNDAAARQGRKSKEELLGYTMMQAYPGIEKTEMFSHLRNCMTNRVPFKMDNEFVFSDKSKGWFELHIEPVPEGILILSIDITKSKESEAELNSYRHRLEHVVAERTAECAQAKEKLPHEINEHQKMEEGLKLRATILDSAHDAIFLINTKGDFAYANKAATKTYGYSLDEFLNMNIRSLLPREAAPSIEPIIATTIDKGELLFETGHMRKDGILMPVRVYFNLVKTARGQFVVVIANSLSPKE